MCARVVILGRMSPMARGPDDWVGGILSRLSRHEPPPVSLDAILERGRRRRQKQLLIGGGVLAAATILLAVVWGGSSEPPVHLDLHIIDVQETTDGQVQIETASWSAVPEEARGP